jgi:N-acetylglutamate synthase-like GNAT family acetyltransferase
LVKESTGVEVTVRRAIREDIPAIQLCIEPFVKQGKILPRTVSELDDLLETYFVAEANGRVMGCAVLEIYSRKLCEIRSLAVLTEAQGLGIGKKLVEACLELAKAEKVHEVMAISSNEEFFQSCGFDFTLPGEKKALFYLP